MEGVGFSKSELATSCLSQFLDNFAKVDIRELVFIYRVCLKNKQPCSERKYGSSQNVCYSIKERWSHANAACSACSLMSSDVVWLNVFPSIRPFIALCQQCAGVWKTRNLN
jgi:hypothetical protein